MVPCCCARGFGGWCTRLWVGCKDFLGGGGGGGEEGTFSYLFLIVASTAIKWFRVYTLFSYLDVSLYKYLHPSPSLS